MKSENQIKKDLENCEMKLITSQKRIEEEQKYSIQLMSQINTLKWALENEEEEEDEDDDYDKAFPTQRKSS